MIIIILSHIKDALIQGNYSRVLKSNERHHLSNRNQEKKLRLKTKFTFFDILS